MSQAATGEALITRRAAWAPALRPWSAATVFVGGLVLLEALAFGVPFAPYVSHYWSLSRSLGEWYRFPAAMAAVVITLGIAAAYVRFTLAAGWPLRAIALLVFGLIVGIEYGYLRVNHDFMRFNDIDTIFKSNLVVWWAAASEFAEWRALVPVLAFAALLRMVPVPARPWGGRALAALLAGTIAFFCALYPFSSGSYPTVALTAFGRDLVYSAFINAKMYRGPRDVITGVSATTPDFNIVLVIDESVRADHLSVNGYQRETTPTLDALAKKGVLTSWGVAAAASTGSVSSNTLLLTGVTALPDRSFRSKWQPTVFQYARAAGFRTVYYDGHTNLLWSLTADDKRYVDEWININDLTYGLDTDARIAQGIQRRAQTSVGNCIVVNKRGIHPPYNDDFPEGKGAWLPVLPHHGLYDPSRPDLIKNSYDSAIRYNVDGFFAQLVSDEMLATTYVLYTSDHGQTLSEGGESWTHGRQTWSEAAVPLLLISGRRHRSAPRSCAASHGNILPTLLDLMQVSYDSTKYSYADSLFGEAPCPPPARRYMWGDLHGHGQYAVEAFDPPKKP